MKKACIFLLLNLLIIVTTNAQKISGKIIDAITKEALIGANVVIYGGGTSTDIDGKYQLQLQKEGEQKLLLSILVIAR